MAAPGCISVEDNSNIKQNMQREIIDLIKGEKVSTFEHIIWWLLVYYHSFEHNADLNTEKLLML